MTAFFSFPTDSSAVEIHHPQQAIDLLESSPATPVEGGDSCGMDSLELVVSLPPLHELINTLYFLLRHRGPGLLMTHELDALGSCWPVIRLVPQLQALRQFPVHALHHHFCQAHPDEIHPYLVEYMRIFAGLNLGAVLDLALSCVDAAHKWLHFLEAKLGDLRRSLWRPEVRRALCRFNFPAGRRTKTFRSYIDDLFKCYSRLLVVRIDLGYLKGLALKPVFAPPSCASMGLQGTIGPTDDLLAYATLRQHRQDLFDFLRSTFGKHLCGYIWKLEYGFEKGYHYHLMLFFNGAHLCRDVNLGRIIGEHWNQVITAGQGNYFNCNAQKERYDGCGIGMVSHREMDKRQHLQVAAAYLGKHDGLVRQDLAPFQRTMGTGRSPMIGLASQAPRRGRPRKT